MVIDELILVLGLDTRKFTEGQRDAVQAFKKGKEGAIDFGKGVQEQAENMSGALGMARKGVLGLVGAFIGGEAAAFVGHVVAMDAATGRLATTSATSVANLSTWQYMIQQVGGSAQSASSAIGTLQQEINNVRQGSGMFEGGFASLMNQAGVSLSDDADSSLRKIQKFISGQIGSGKMRADEGATFLRRVPGMNEDMVNLMLADFNKLEAAAREAGTATNETAKAAQDLVAKFSLITQSMERFAASMIPVIDLLMKPINAITGADLKKVFPGSNDMFTRDGPMDKLDRFLWGDHNMDDAKKRLADGLRGGAGGGSGSPYRDAIAAVESAGSGGYAARGPATASGDRAYGRYQIMGNNIGPWSQEALGRRVSIEEFMANPALQDQIFDKKFGSYVEKYGPQGASRAWLAGEGGMNDPSRRDSYGTNVLEYQSRFNKALGARGTAGSRGAPALNNSSSEVHIGTMHINAPKADDADGIASDIGGALKRQSMIAPVNNALV